ncbi:MAG: sigma-70 family RNA polymerase sigma factor [Deltaproteobacteria bacterium]|nr:sigma-70 family RNA polymerase sigma factor [Deltaproteobacteria bacterium]
MEPQEQITKVLLAHGRGEEGAFGQLVPLVYEDLRRIAHRQLRRNQPGHTLNTTGLVHEAYLKMVDQTRVSWQDRSHFYAISARAMRQIIIDYARKRLAEKRGGGQHHTSLEEKQIAIEQEADWLVSLDQALGRLGKMDERLARVVECRFFAGFTEEETAEALGVSVRTVQRDWMRARGWLREEMRN